MLMSPVISFGEARTKPRAPKTAHTLLREKLAAFERCLAVAEDHIRSQELALAHLQRHGEDTTAAQRVLQILHGVRHSHATDCEAIRRQIDDAR